MTRNERPNRPAAPLDPGSRDPEYWSRFRRRTTALAEPELERRRQRSYETVSAVVTSWSRTIVPMAAAVAALAALLILVDSSSEATPSSPAGVQELVESAMTTDPIPALMSSDDSAVSVTMIDGSF